MSFWAYLYRSKITKYLPGYFRKKLRKNFNYYFVETRLNQLPKKNYPFMMTLKDQENLMNRFNSQYYVPWTSCPYLVQKLKGIFLDHSSKLNFLDFGGENIDYFLYLKKNFKNLNYFYFNQKLNNDILLELKKKHSIRDFNIISNIEDIKKNKYHFVNLGSVIQYIENYKDILKMLMDTNPEYIFLSGVSFYFDKNKQKTTIVVKQLNASPQINFLYFFEYNSFIEIFKLEKFDVIFKNSNNTDNINYKNFFNKYGKIEYIDILLKNFNG